MCPRSQHFLVATCAPKNMILLEVVDFNRVERTKINAGTRTSKLTEITNAQRFEDTRFGLGLVVKIVQVQTLYS